MDKFPGLKLRTTTDGELQGIDYDQFNEYTHDYIEFQRDLYSTVRKPSKNNLLTVATVGLRMSTHRQSPCRVDPNLSSNNATNNYF